MADDKDDDWEYMDEHFEKMLADIELKLSQSAQKEEPYSQKGKMEIMNLEDYIRETRGFSDNVQKNVESFPLLYTKKLEKDKTNDISSELDIFDIAPATKLYAALLVAATETQRNIKNKKEKDK